MSWLGPRSILAECPRWDDESERLHWVDIDGGVLHEAALPGDDRTGAQHESGGSHEAPSDGRTSTHHEPGASAGDGWVSARHEPGAPLAGAVRLDAAGPARWLVAVGGSLAEWTPGRGLRATVVVEAPSAACPVRLNELVTDPSGRVWVGSMAYDWTHGAGSFHRVDADGSVHRMVEGVTICNGIGWSPDATTMYTTDTAAGQITAWAYEPDRGTPSRPRPFVVAEPDAGRPDGLAVDTDGNVWSAFAGGFRVCCFDPSGREIERVRVPAPNPTSCCFAGPARDRLFVTTGRKRLPDDALTRYPDSGRIWAAGALGARGLPQRRGRVRLADRQEVRR